MIQDIPPQGRSNACTRDVLRFGNLTAGNCDRSARPRANGLLRLAVNAHLVVFSAQRRFMMVTQ